MAAATALAEAGPGRPSVDDALLPRFRGTTWALLGLGAAVAGSYLATSDAVSEALPEPTDEPAHGGEDGEPAHRFAREPSPAPAERSA